MIERDVARDPETRLAYSTGGARRPQPALPHKEPQGAKDRSGIRLRLKGRASGRVVTVVSGLPGAAAEVAALARTLKAACGAGGTVKDGALELQGDQREKVEAELARRGLKSKRAGG